MYSSLAYQGYGRELDVDEIRHLNEWGTGGLWPTMVVFLDTPDDVIAERMSRRDLDRFEAAGDEFHARVLAGFRTMAAADPDRWITIQAVGSVDRVAEEIRRRSTSGVRCDRDRLGDRHRPGPIWDDVIGQTDAVRNLRAAAERGPVHAYLFVGPAGSTKLQAARAFAARLMSGGEDPDQRDAALILRGEHPTSARCAAPAPRFDADQAEEIIHVASLTPTEGSRR